MSSGRNQQKSNVSSSGRQPSEKGSFGPNQEHNEQVDNAFDEDFDPIRLLMSTDYDATQCPPGYTEDPRVERVRETIPNEHASPSQHRHQYGASRATSGRGNDRGPTTTPGTASSSAGGDRRPKITLREDGTIKLSYKVSNKCTKIIRKITSVDGCTWKKVPKQTKERYWDEFKKTYQWDEEDTLVRHAFNQLMGKRYADMLNKAKAGNEKPDWLAEDAWARWQFHWNSEEFKKKSRQNAANRRGSTSQGRCEHTGGSVSFADHYDRMAARDGYPPSAIDLYLETHTRDHDKKTFRSEKSKQISDAYEAAYDEATEHALEMSDPPNVNPNDIFLQVIGNVNNGKCSGLSSATSIYYPDVASTSTGSRGGSSQRAELNILRDLVATQASKIESQESKLQSMEAKLLRMDQVEADLAMMRNMFIEMQKQTASRKKKTNTNHKAPIVDDSETESE